MKITYFIMSFVLALCMPYYAFATTSSTHHVESTLVDSENKADNIPEDTQAEGPDLIPLLPPEKHIVGEISYISGGVSQDEAAEMKRMAINYPLEVVCVQKTEEGEGYLAEVMLHITDTKGNVLLDITTDGPILLADLPNGKYQIIAEHNNAFRINHVNISNKKHQRIVFSWPM